MLGLVLTLVLLLFAVATPAFAQQQVEIVTPTRGSTPAALPTATCVDANHCGTDVNIVGGGGTGGTASTFGAAFPATGTAAGFKDASGNMAGANLDSSGNLKVDCVTGCPSSSSSALLTGQQAVTTSCVALPAQTVKAVTVQSDPDNTAAIYVGPTGCTTANAYKLLPGSVTPLLALTNVNEVFVVAASTGQTVIWLGSN